MLHSILCRTGFRRATELTLFGFLVLISGSVAARGAEIMQTMTEGKPVPLVIAHRGASGLRPEHTIESYRLAIEQGADYIEPDLVMTKDKQFVARHDIYMSTTTDVADHPEFADRKRVFEGREDWFVFDFTLGELKTLRARQPFEGRSKEFDGLYLIPTLEEVAALALGAAGEGRNIGIYPELKRPDIYMEMGLNPADALASHLRRIKARGTPIIFQCFYPQYIKALHDRIDLPMILLLGDVKQEDGTVAPNLDYKPWRDVIDGLGISKGLLLAGETLGSYMKEAQSNGLMVHLWTIRDDQVPAQFSDSREEMKLYFDLGADGVFSDFPGTARTVLDTLYKSH